MVWAWPSSAPTCLCNYFLFPPSLPPLLPSKSLSHKSWQKHPIKTNAAILVFEVLIEEIMESKNLLGERSSYGLITKGWTFFKTPLAKLVGFSSWWVRCLRRCGFASGERVPPTPLASRYQKTTPEQVISPKKDNQLRTQDIWRQPQTWRWPQKIGVNHKWGWPIISLP